MIGYEAINSSSISHKPNSSASELCVKLSYRKQPGPHPASITSFGWFSQLEASIYSGFAHVLPIFLMIFPLKIVKFPMNMVKFPC